MNSEEQINREVDAFLASLKGTDMEHVPAVWTRVCNDVRAFADAQAHRLFGVRTTEGAKVRMMQGLAAYLLCYYAERVIVAQAAEIASTKADPFAAFDAEFSEDKMREAQARVTLEFIKAVSPAMTLSLLQAHRQMRAVLKDVFAEAAKNMPTAGNA